MMHPSRQAYVEEDGREVSFSSRDLVSIRLFIRVLQICEASLQGILAGQSQRDEG